MPTTLNTIAGVTARSPDNRTLSTAPKMSPIASIGPQPIAYITAMIPNTCTATRTHTHSMVSCSSLRTVAIDVARNDAARSAQRSQSGVGEISPRRLAAQNTGATMGSVSTVGSLSRTQSRDPKLGGSVDASIEGLSTCRKRRLTGQHDQPTLPGPGGERPAAPGDGGRPFDQAPGGGRVGGPAEVEALGEVAAALERAPRPAPRSRRLRRPGPGRGCGRSARSRSRATSPSG